MKFAACLLLAAAALAQETPTERDAARDVLRKMDTSRSRSTFRLGRAVQRAKLRPRSGDRPRQATHGDANCSR